MKKFFNSTRNKNILVSGKEAVLQGLAPDGGLYVFDELGKETINLADVQSMTYHEMASLILSKLLPGYSVEELKVAVQKAYGNTFATDEITPVASVGPHHFLELFHGPTSAFKDVALQMLPQLMSLSLQEEKDKQVMILTATSGDTGKAALCGFQDVPRTGIIVFYPKDGTSKVQELQMVTQEGDNTGVCSLYGNFDDAQSQVKSFFQGLSSGEIPSEDNLLFSSANSINIGRLAPQVVYYFYSYMQLVKKGTIKLGDNVSFCVPTGNFGDILAGYYAKLLGLPVHKLVVASNANNVLTDFFATGVYDRRRPFHKTLSPSMDILISSNLERLLYYMSGQNDSYTASLMKDLAENGFYEINDELKSNLSSLFFAGYATDEQCSVAMKEVFDTYGYVMDPHTAVGYHVMKQFEQVDNSCPCILLSTASPYKFSAQVYEAITGNAPSSDEFESMELLSKKTNTTIPTNLAQLKEKAVLHKDLVEKDQLKDYILSKTATLLAK